MSKKNKIIIGILLITAILVVTGVSYAIWSMTLIPESSNVITTGCFNIEFQDQNTINLQSAYPISDEEANDLIPYTFTIKNTCDSIVSYQINLEILNTTTLTMVDVINTKLNENIFNLTNELEVEKTLENAESSYRLEIGSLKAQETKTFELRLWMNEDTPAIPEVMNKTFESKITITVAHQKNMYIEPLLNGMDPVLKEELIPVRIENDGTVYKANTEQKWYSYENKEWANAIILKDESIVYQNGEIIPEENIESYFVWIPKYRYQLWDLGNYNSLTTIDESKVHTIPIIFGDYNTRDEVDGECTTPKESGASGYCQVGDYMTHPAFLSIQSNGFWVGKFETSKSNSNADNSINTEGIQIKPNIVSWRNIQVANAFYTTYDYKRNLDSHMMKNTEWGAVAYLSQSIYGIHEEIRLNNSNYITGASANQPYAAQSDTNWSRYNTEVGYLASTTGNITGIYDMSGGAAEIVMTIQENVQLSDLMLTIISDFYTNLKWQKYYDFYKSSNKIRFSNRILGDATGEMGPFYNVGLMSGITRAASSWYNNISYFFRTDYMWFGRGGSPFDRNGGGIFTFCHSKEETMLYNQGFRIVLTPVN